MFQDEDTPVFYGRQISSVWRVEDYYPQVLLAAYKGAQCITWRPLL